MEDYKRYESEFGVIPPAAGFDYIKQTKRNALRKLLGSNWHIFALSAAVVLTLIGLIIKTVYRRRQAKPL